MTGDVQEELDRAQIYAPKRPHGETSTNGKAAPADADGVRQLAAYTDDARTAPGPLTTWDGGADYGKIPPRAWLLGTLFCRRYVSGLIAAGGTGKTALRYLQYLSLASGQSLTGAHVHKRARVLIISLEDGANELRRRIEAARLHHGLNHDDLRGWLHLATPGAQAGKLMEMDERGRAIRGALYASICETIDKLGIDLIAFDPFVKLHALEENANSQLDTMMQDLADLADAKNIAIDIIHHAKKGATAPGDSDLGRGASAVRDGCRLVQTLTTMTPEEAQNFGIEERQRRQYVRADAAKINLAPPAGQADWFRLVGISLDNGTEEYPNGDNVQTVEPWSPPDLWEGLNIHLLNRMLDDIAAGMNDGSLYSDHGAATTRGAWQVVQGHAPERTEKECRRIINTWVKNGVLQRTTYYDTQARKERIGLTVNDSQRPG